MHRRDEILDFQKHGSGVRKCRRSSPDYNEAQLRIDFINPMFRELGWDVDNTQGFAEQYREVVYEDRLKVGGATKAPDYSFRVGGPRKFFLEAKKPSVNLKEIGGPMGCNYPN